MRASVIIFPLARRRDALLKQCSFRPASASAGRIITGPETFDVALAHCPDRIAEGRLLLDEFRAEVNPAERDLIAARR